MSYQLMEETHPKAKKDHICIWCGQKIEVGTKYRREKSIYDGQWQDHAWHLECDKAFNEEDLNDGELEIVPYENERPTP